MKPHPIFDLAFQCLNIQSEMLTGTTLKKPEGICPDCGSNTLQHERGLLMGEDWTPSHAYKNLQDLDEPDWYRCENGHQFKVYYDESNDEFYIK